VTIRQERTARKRGKRINHRYGDLVKIAAEVSGRSTAMIYAVLTGRATSEPVQRAIEAAREQIRRARKRAA
jgi:hypothetical protein